MPPPDPTADTELPEQPPPPPDPFNPSRAFAGLDLPTYGVAWDRGVLGRQVPTGPDEQSLYLPGFAPGVYKPVPA